MKTRLLCVSAFKFDVKDKNDIVNALFFVASLTCQISEGVQNRAVPSVRTA